jgi:hypothetical protein
MVPCPPFVAPSVAYLQLLLFGAEQKDLAVAINNLIYSTNNQLLGQPAIQLARRSVARRLESASSYGFYISLHIDTGHLDPVASPRWSLLQSIPTSSAWAPNRIYAYEYGRRQQRSGFSGRCWRNGGEINYEIVGESPQCLEYRITSRIEDASQHAIEKDDFLSRYIDKKTEKSQQFRTR